MPQHPTLQTYESSTKHPTVSPKPILQWQNASDGTTDFAGNIVQRPVCPGCLKQMTWFGHEISYFCYTRDCENYSKSVKEILDAS